MARQGGYRGRRGGRGGGGKKKKVCRFCVAPQENILDYKNVPLLKRYLDDESAIRKARQTGTCRKHQSQLANEIKVARELALISFIPE
ncbi:MAG: 30S ribosomal protein S18 [Armatimonadota bacterium]